VIFSHRGSKELIVGSSGYGKTTLFLHRLRHTTANKVFIFDHEGEISLKTKLVACHSLEDLQKVAVSNKYILFDPSTLYPGQLEEGFACYCRWSFELSKITRGIKLLACDELQKLTGTNNCPHDLLVVLETGRRHGLDLLAVSQQPNLIHNRIRNQLTRLSCFRLNDPTARKFPAMLGLQEEEISKLQHGQYVDYNLVTSETKKYRIF
jgi:hypothetical protein